MNIVQRLLNLALVGGEWVLYLLLLSSVLSIAVMIEKAIMFYRNRIAWDDFSEMLSSFLNRGDTIAALEYAGKAHESRGPHAGSRPEEPKKGPAAVEEI